MSYEAVAAEAISQFSADETFIGQFYGYSFASAWMRMLLGVLSSFLMRHYLVVVSSQKLYICKVNLLNKLENIDIFEFHDVKEVIIKSGFLTNQCKFIFKNGKKLDLKTAKKALRKKQSDLYFNDETADFLKAHIR